MEGKRVDTKLMLFTLVLILIALLLLNWLLGNRKVEGMWNYEEIETAANLIYQGERVEDREIYYTLENIIKQYLNSYKDTYTEDVNEVKMSYTEYYDYLTKNYKDYLSQSEYNKVAEKFLDKFYAEAESEYEKMEFMDVEQILKEVYSFENGVYICRLESTYTGNEGYIAIALNTNKNAYNFVYIE